MKCLIRINVPLERLKQNKIPIKLRFIKTRIKRRQRKIILTIYLKLRFSSGPPQDTDQHPFINTESGQPGNELTALHSKGRFQCPSEKEKLAKRNRDWTAFK